MIRVKDIYCAIDEIAPFAWALDFDNAGILVGDENAEVTRAIIALDITREVVEEAVSLGANLIISHHPVIFNPLLSLKADSVPALLIANGCTALCCHTNLDLCGALGTNRALAELLGLKNFQAEECGGDILFSGELPEPLSPQEFAAFVKRALSASGLRFSPGEREVEKVFFCSGAGGDMGVLAAELGADAFLTGEVKHHEALALRERGVTLIEAGHYETEKPFGPLLAAYLKKRFSSTGFLLSKVEKPPMLVV